MAEIRVADKDTLDRVARAVGVKDENRIYGIKINKYDSNPDTRCTYLGDAVGMTPAKMNFRTGEFDYGDWADAWFVRDNFPCMLKRNGAIDYKLDPNHYGKKEDGTPSDVANTTYDGNAMSAIPTVWIWQYELGDFKYIWLANYKVNDNYKAYAHQRPDGSIAPYVFMSIYKGSTKTLGDRVCLCSLSSTVGSTYGKYTAQEEDVLIKNWLATSWRKKTWFQRNLMQCLITMIICSTDASSKLGGGSYYGDTLNSAINATGTLDRKGQFFGYNDTQHHMKAFHQEDVWGGTWDRIDGLRLVNGHLIIENKYDLVLPRQYDVGGWFHNTIMTEFGDFPIDVDGSGTTYECSTVLLGNNTSERYPIVGGPNSSKMGLYNYCDNTSSGYKTRVGVSLSCLP